jgi:hypothetical protein
MPTDTERQQNCGNSKHTAQGSNVGNSVKIPKQSKINESQQSIVLNDVIPHQFNTAVTMTTLNLNEIPKAC